MINTKYKSILFIALVAMTTACSNDEPIPTNSNQSTQVTADTVVRAGKFYTLEADAAWVEAVAIKDGRYIFVGASEEANTYIGRRTNVIDLQGRMAMPGINDAHVHAISGSMDQLFQCRFGFTATLEEIAEALQTCVDNTPGDWIRGGQWTSSFFENNQLESPRQWLDRYSSDKAVYFSDDSGHNAWVNTKALELAGITSETSDPISGSIVRDAISGEPNGILVETAMLLVDKYIPNWSADQYTQGARAALDNMTALGITGYKEAISTDDHLKAYQSLDQQGLVAMHVVACLDTPWDYRDQDLDISTYIARREQYSSQHLAPECVKLFMDGVPTVARTAAMIDPYAEDEKHGDNFTGEVKIAPAQLNDDIQALDAAGFTVKIHTAGDRAVRITLDAIEAARKVNGMNDLRHELAHASYINPADYVRFKDLNAVADYSPYIWHPSAIIDSEFEALGSARANMKFPTRSLLDSGVMIAPGSDWPAAVPSANPWVAIEALVTRQDPYGNHPGNLEPSEVITLDEALQLFTLNGAMALRLGDQTGSIKPGKLADFIVLDQNIFEVTINDVGNTNVLMTFFEGKLVYEK